MTDNKHYPWQDGLPTGPDVQLLMSRWPDLKVGDRIEYADVADVLKVDRGSGRWRSITSQWRKRLLELGLVVECETDTAFYVATADQISAATYSTLKMIGKKAQRHRRKLSVANPETEAQKNAIEHQGRLMLAIERDAKKSRKELPNVPAAANSPRIAPPDC